LPLFIASITCQRGLLTSLIAPWQPIGEQKRRSKSKVEGKLSLLFKLSNSKKKLKKIIMTPPTPTKKLFTLVLIHDRPNRRLLLGRKKRGIGAGNFNGFGGKVEKENDKSIVASALRELKEEAGVGPDARGLSRRGVLSFHFLDTPAEVWETHLFSGEGLDGEPQETEEMEPRWFGVEEVPYEQMWQDDKFWLPAILGGGEEGEGAAEQARKSVIGEFWVSSKKKSLLLF